MIEFLQECVNYVNLPATTLMVMVLLYWIMVMVGVFGLDAVDLDFDADIPDMGLDADIGIDADIGLDADVGIDGGIETAPGTAFSGGSSTTGNDGVARQLFEFFHLGEIPLVIIATFFMLFFWVSTMVSNHYYNMDQQLIPSLIWLLPNLLISLVLTRIAMIPFVFIFKKPPPDDKSRKNLYGVVGEVISLEVTEKHGQIEIKLDGEPEMKLNAHCAPGKRLGKGDAAKIISYNPADGTFLVELTKWENEVDG